jgi:dCMP deaminase
MTEADIERLFREIYTYAINHSTDKSTQVAAFIIKGQHQVAEAANRFPVGVKESIERWQRPLKYDFVEHAERNCVYDAARRGRSLSGGTLICPSVPCPDCARAIIQSGIIKVINHKSAIDWTGSHWQEKFDITLQMFKESQVEYEVYTGKIFKNDEVKVLIDGELKSP